MKFLIVIALSFVTSGIANAESITKIVLKDRHAQASSIEDCAKKLIETSLFDHLQIKNNAISLTNRLGSTEAGREANSDWGGSDYLVSLIASDGTPLTGYANILFSNTFDQLQNLTETNCRWNFSTAFVFSLSNANSGKEVLFGYRGTH